MKTSSNAKPRRRRNAPTTPPPTHLSDGKLPSKRNHGPLTHEQQRSLRRLVRGVPGLGKLVAQIHSWADYYKHHHEIWLRTLKWCLKDILQLEDFAVGALGMPPRPDVLILKSALEESELRIKAGDVSADEDFFAPVLAAMAGLYK